MGVESYKYVPVNVGTEAAGACFCQQRRQDSQPSGSTRRAANVVQVTLSGCHLDVAQQAPFRSGYQCSIQSDLPLIVVLERELGFYFCPCCQAHHAQIVAMLMTP